MSRSRSDEVDALLSRVERAGDADARPLLERLAELTEPGTEAWSLANRELARILLEHEPWRASVFARRVVDQDPGDHLAWGILGLSQSLLGNHGFAVAAYERALRLAPDNPWYLHNLGHLYDAMLDRPAEAIPLLRRALLRLADDPHVLASLAHALARAGEPTEARALMRRVVRSPATEEHHALYRWLIDLSERAVERHLERQGPMPRRKVRVRRATKS